MIETKYIQEDSNLRSYSGHQIEEGYFKECLSNEVFESLVDIETTDALKPAILKGLNEETFLYLLMPVRVS